MTGNNLDFIPPETIHQLLVDFPAAFSVENEKLVPSNDAPTEAKKDIQNLCDLAEPVVRLGVAMVFSPARRPTNINDMVRAMNFLMTYKTGDFDDWK